jgi:hypothetical protein
LDWFTDVELELPAVAEPVVIDADEDPDDDEVAESEPVDAVVTMCTAELADSARSRRDSALEDQESRPEFRLATPELFGGQAAAGGAGDAGAPRPLGPLGGVVLVSGDSARGSRFGGVVRGLPILAWESPPLVLKLIHAAPATPSESDSARAPTPAPMTRRRRCSRNVTAASMRSAIVADGE